MDKQDTKEEYREYVTRQYIETQFEIQEQIKKLQNLLADHNEKAIDIDWDSVGDMRRILSQLEILTGEENE